MDGRISMYVLLVCVWCSLDTGGLLMVVTARPTVSVEILTPEADRKEGGQVDMRCTATNLESDHIVEWRSLHHVLRWGTTTFSTNQRFTFTTDPSSEVTFQNFAITDLQMIDSGVYVCNIKNPQEGYAIVDTSYVTLAVFHPGLVPTEPTVSSPSGPWVVTLAVCLVLLAAVLLVITAMVTLNVIIGGQISDQKPPQPETNPYTELQQPVNGNSDYTTPTRPLDTSHHNQVESDYDYPQVDGSTWL